MKFNKELITVMRNTIKYYDIKHTRNKIRTYEDVLNKIPTVYDIRFKFTTAFGVFDIALYNNNVLKYLIEVPLNDKEADSSIRKLVDVIASVKKVKCIIVYKNYKRIRKIMRHSSNIYYKHLIVCGFNQVRKYVK